MIETVKKTPRPNYTPQQYSDALERAMMRAKYPELYLQIIDNYLKIQENEYDAEISQPQRIH